jgi:NAD(P)-dependent dehydrogenase (short-subunit alcohol dehydrogenase family)
MSKAALNMASVILQNYLREKGIKVLAVHPGWMRTRMGGEDAKYDTLEYINRNFPGRVEQRLDLFVRLIYGALTQYR